MGRGLSNLQKDILRLVYERRQERGERDHTGERWYYDMHAKMLLAQLHDWPDKSGKRWSEYDERRREHEYRWRGFGHNFRRSRIGKEEYNRKTAAFYRAVTRLKERGLLEDSGAGLSITDEGIRVVENLSVSNGVGTAVS